PSRPCPIFDLCPRPAVDCVASGDAPWAVEGGPGRPEAVRKYQRTYPGGTGSAACGVGGGAAILGSRGADPDSDPGRAWSPRAGAARPTAPSERPAVRRELRTAGGRDAAGVPHVALA